MKLRNLLIILIISLLFITSCSSFFIVASTGQGGDDNDNLPCKINCEPKYRNSGICNDGTKVNGNGEGQCKHNGGVKCWFCSD